MTRFINALKSRFARNNAVAQRLEDYLAHIEAQKAA